MGILSLVRQFKILFFSFLALLSLTSWSEDKLILGDQFVMRVSGSTYSIQDFVSLAQDLKELRCIDKKNALFSVVKLKENDLVKLVDERSGQNDLIKPLNIFEKRVLYTLLDVLKIEHYLKDTLKYKAESKFVLDKKSCAGKNGVRPGTKKLLAISGFIEEKYFQSKNRKLEVGSKNLSLTLFTESVSKQVEHQTLW